MLSKILVAWFIALAIAGCTTTRNEERTRSEFTSLVTTMDAAATQGQGILETQKVARVGTDYVVDDIKTTAGSLIKYQINTDKCVSPEMLFHALQPLHYVRKQKGMPLHRAVESYDSYEKSTSSQLVQVNADFNYVDTSWCMSALFINSRKKQYAMPT